MLRGYLWGRPKWVWAADVVIVVGFGLTALTTGVPALKVFLALIVLLRIVLAVVVTLLWRARQRTEGPGAR